jgi:dihydrofolate synthase/folylpolyglutamate synthase
LEGLESVQKSTYFIGRNMILQENPLILAESAHNEAGIQELLKVLADLKYEHLHFVYGTVADKDLSTVLPHLPKNASYYFCKADIPRGMDAQDIM